MFTDLQEFKSFIKESIPEDTVDFFAQNDEVACCDKDIYSFFKDYIAKEFAGVENVIIMGSGNWGFSLNPYKIFSRYSKQSDIDVAIISKLEFTDTWQELRYYHRSRWYQLGKTEQDRIKRNGENVYSGFISPKWIPEKGNKVRFRFLNKIEQIPQDLFDYRDINMMFFKDYEELVDYYKRGFINARRKLDGI